MARDWQGGFRFPTTRASALLGARSPDPAERARSADRIALAYWKPAYKYARVRWRLSPEDAEDAVQEFFTTVVARDVISAYEPARGRFRTYLRACLDRFVVDLGRRERAKKRGGGAGRLAIDFADAEAEIALGATPAADALDEYFDAEFVRHVLSMSIATLQGELEAKGKSVHFSVFERLYLAGDDEPSYARIAGELGISVTDVTNRLTYARRELRRIVLDTLRDVTATEAEFKSEARAVLGVAG